MKKMKKLASVLLALVMTLAMAMPIFAEQVQSATSPTGSITIKDSATVKVEEKNFRFYRILNATVSGDNVAYTVPDGLKDFYIEYFKLDASASNADIVAKVDAITDATSLQELAKDFMNLDAETKKKYEVAATRGSYENNQIKYSDLPYGYYLIDDQAIDKTASILMLDTTMPDATITLKANVPTPQKTVDKHETSIGDPRLYTLSAPIPNMEGYDNYRFVFMDSLTRGLTFTEAVSKEKKTGIQRVVIASYTEGEDPEQPEKVVYKIDEILYELKAGTITDGTVTGEGTQLYALEVTDATATDGQKLKITFGNFIQYWNQKITLDNYSKYRVFIEYYATPNELAAVAPSKTENTVELWYDNDPQPEGDGYKDEIGDNEPVGKSEKIKEYVYTAQIELTKVDGKDQTKKLTGAQFNITGQSVKKVVVEGYKYVEDASGDYWALKEGENISYTTDDPTTPGMNTEKYVKDSNNQYVKYRRKAATIDDATIGDGVEFVNTTIEVGEDGKLVFKGLGVGEYTITEVKAPEGYNLLTTPIKFEIIYENGEFKVKENEAEVTADNGQLAVTVINNAGAELPSTGGIGTTIFYVVGTILVLGAGILLVTKRRMKAQ